MCHLLIKRRARVATTGLLAICAAACTEKQPDDYNKPVLAFDSAAVRLMADGDTVVVRAELALTPEQKTLGLMERRQLSADAGMLFVYDSTQNASAGFWMYRTHIPLDIAFVDAAGIIRAILAMQPCETTLPEGCPTYQPGVPYQYALEVNAGFFQRHGIQIGDTIVSSDLPRARSGS